MTTETRIRSERAPSESGGPLEQALAAVRSDPGRLDLWDDLESLSEREQWPDDAAALYRELLARVPAEVRGDVAERGVAFHDAWFGEGSSQLTEMLGRVVELDPSVSWAFQRLTMLFTVGERWDELFALYDRVIAATPDADAKTALLDEAAQSAKDLAGRPERAIGYLEELAEARPTDAQVAVSLERSYERLERHADLARFLGARLSRLRGRARTETRLRIAKLRLESLADPVGALDEIERLLAEEPDDATAAALLGRMFDDDSLDVVVRRRAFDRLRERAEREGRESDVVGLVERALEFTGEHDAAALRRDAAERFVARGELDEAFSHVLAWLEVDPASEVARKRLADLAPQIGADERRVTALLAAAEATRGAPAHRELAAEAADVLADTLGQTSRAIDVLLELLDEADEPTADTKTIVVRLAELYARGDDSLARLAMLERWAALEEGPVEQSARLAEVAQLATALGEHERALAAWRRRLAHDASDLEALEAIAGILEREGRFAELVDALRARLAAGVAPTQRRLDLVRIGHIQHKLLDRPEAAIDTFHEVVSAFGEDVEIVDALCELYERTQRADELVRLLERSSDRENRHLAEVETRLGDALRERMERPAEALDRYVRALASDVTHEPARDGLRALLENVTTRGVAAKHLARVYRETGETERIPELLPARLAEARTSRERAEAYAEAASIHERAGRMGELLVALAGALRAEPDDATHDLGLERAAESVGRLDVAADALRDAGIALALTTSDTPAGFERRRARARVSSLRLAEARLRERLGEPAGALDAYVGALEAAPHDVDIASALVRTAEQVGRPEMAEDALAGALAETTPDAPRLRLLVGIRRARRDRALFDTLIALADVSPDDLDPLLEAAELAAASLHDEALTLGVTTRLYEEAARLWRRQRRAVGERSAERCATWAVDHLVRLYEGRGDHERSVSLLVDASRLPCEPTVSRIMRRRAAAIAKDALSDTRRAMELYRGLLDEVRDDADAIRTLADLYAAEGHLPELLSLRLHELRIVEEPERRLELRLDVSRLVGELESQGGRLESLRANLEEAPGHEATLAALEDVLGGQTRYAELADVLEGQARRLEAAGDADRASRLYVKVAALAESQLGDETRALAAHRKVVELSGATPSLDALARIHLARSEHLAAAQWLERRLSGSEEHERVPMALRLAKALLAGGKAERATVVLERAHESAPEDAEIRGLLANEYRRAERFAPLADLLARGAMTTDDAEEALPVLREAARLFCETLGTPERALTVLRRAHSLAPTDRWFAQSLADALRASGELGEAETLLTRMVEDFGRRRGPERAQVHALLARVKRQAGDLEGAIVELDQATKMDVSNAELLRALGDLAREAGDVERAERSYRALLLLARRVRADELGVGVAEVTFALERIARERGDERQADELLASALETASQSAIETKRLVALLASRGHPDLVLRAVEQRLGTSLEPGERSALLGDKGAALESLGRLEEAFEVRLEGLAAAPTDPARQEDTRTLAKRVGKSAHYVERLRAAIGALRRGEDEAALAALLVPLAEALEEDVGDLEGASEAYRRLELSPAERPRALRALARLAGKRGAADEELSWLARLAGGEDEGVPHDESVEASYRIAEVLLAGGQVDEGASALGKALRRDADAARAGRIVREAVARGAASRELDELYERAARASGDDALLVDFLERRALGDDAAVEHVREALDRAEALARSTSAGGGDHDPRVERLLERYIDVVDRAEGPAAALATMQTLADRHRARGDLDGAVRWIERAAEVADGDELRALRRQLASLAGARGDVAAAAAAFEALASDAPTDPEVYRPWLAACVELGDVDRLAHAARSTIDALLEPSARNEVRVLLVDVLEPNPERVHDAIELLREVLGEEPDHRVAGERLASLYERIGFDEDLVELLVRQLDAARDDGAPEDVVQLTLRLGALLAKVRQDEAIDVYRRALESVPDSREVVLALLPLLAADEHARDRIELRERLLASSSGAEALELSLELGAAYEEIGDADAAVRVLEAGYAILPSDPRVRGQLEQRYRDAEDWSRLVDFLSREAERTEDVDERVRLYRESARVRRVSLGDLHAAALELEKAREAAPDDDDLLEEQVDAFLVAGEYAGARSAVAERLERAQDDGARLRWLRLRARIAREAGDDLAAIDDLEAAYVVSPAEVANELADALDVRRQDAATRGERGIERAATHRLAAVLDAADRQDDARRVLVAWLSNEPDDVDALHAILSLDRKAGRSQGVAMAAQRLVYLESGDARASAALELADACDAVGRPDEARPALEHVLAQEPDRREIRERLRALYARVGAHGELARLLLLEADATTGDERFDLLRRAGALLLGPGDDAEHAIPVLEQALAARGDDHETSLHLVDAYIATGRMVEAGQRLEHAIETHPKRRSPELAQLQHRMARLARAAGDPHIEVQWLGAALDSDKNSGVIAAELARLAMELGDYDTALNALRAITLMKSDDGPMTRAMAFLLQARIAYQRGEQRRAVLWARKALSEDPDLSEADAFLREIGES